MRCPSSLCTLSLFLFSLLLGTMYVYYLSAWSSLILITERDDYIPNLKFSYFSFLPAQAWQVACLACCGAPAAKVTTSVCEPKKSTKPKKDQECWNHAKLESQYKDGKPQYKWKCNYCHCEQTNNSVDRVRKHMAKFSQVKAVFVLMHS